MLKVLVYNNISEKGLERLDENLYQFTKDLTQVDAILLRSEKLHDMEIPKSLRAVGRAGAGVNNIPVDVMSSHGIPVFNTPGANANAVKELVVAGLLLSCRHLFEAWDYVRGLDGNGAEISSAVEAGKKKYAGIELPGRTIGVVGLGAIGRTVANICLQLGMNVVGYDPMLTVDGALELSSKVERVRNLKDLFAKSEFITFHVPLDDSTRNMINADAIASLRNGVTLLNFSRDSVVDDKALCEALESGKIAVYVTDFPNKALQGQNNVISLPHLGASTREAEENCAVMVVDQVKEFLENGNIQNSVNFPGVDMPRGTPYRLIVANSNVPNMLGQISTTMADAGLNIHDMMNQSKNELAYTVVDTDSTISDQIVKKICGIDGVMMAQRL